MAAALRSRVAACRWGGPRAAGARCRRATTAARASAAAGPSGDGKRYVRDVKASAAAAPTPFDQASVPSFEAQPSRAIEGAAEYQTLRKTKIVGTIGPSTWDRESLFKLCDAGLNVARLNMSHGDHESHGRVVDLIKEYNSLGRNHVAILVDTKGPEVRSGDLSAPIELQPGDPLTFTIEQHVKGEDSRVSVNYDGFVSDVHEGDELLVDGGIMALEVVGKSATEVYCRTVDGGSLKSRRHLNVRGRSATLPSLTEKDWEDINFGIDHGVDFFALSFVNGPEVVDEVRAHIEARGARAGILPKIESVKAVQNIAAILEAADGAMVARGDLGAEMPLEDVPMLQTDIIRRCRTLGKPVIVATNMLESMIEYPTPTRAEVSDISIAVREGTDAVMLSGETAHGEHPNKALAVMASVARRTEQHLAERGVGAALAPEVLSDHDAMLRGKSIFTGHVAEMMACHAAAMANSLNCPIVVFTKSGSMAALLAHYRPRQPVFAFTNSAETRRRLALYHGVYAYEVPFTEDREETFDAALELLKGEGYIDEGDQVAILQSGKTPIWRKESNHIINVRSVH